VKSGSTCPTAQIREVVLHPANRGSLRYGGLGGNWWWDVLEVDDVSSGRWLAGGTIG
jgi:hypothetical protein